MMYGLLLTVAVLFFYSHKDIMFFYFLTRIEFRTQVGAIFPEIPLAEIASNVSEKQASSKLICGSSSVPSSEV